MSHAEPSESVDALVAEILEARRIGKGVDCEAILKQHPELATELSIFLEDYECVEDKFAALRQLTGNTALGDVSELATLGMDDTAVPAPHKTGTSFGDYDLLAEVARGGMGVVYRARQKSLNRVVALKMVLGDRGNATDRDRFLVEARAVARLNHPHIVPIYEVGEHDGQSYFTMEFFTGGSLGEKLDSLLADQRAAARMMVTIARAVEHAHRRGILHRDIKPNNVLLDERGEPHVTDFGLAKQLDEESDLTQAGAIVGTPSYMAPEQAQALTDLTTAVDVYGLGALLYELLTGRPPFKGNTPLETLLAAVSDEPKRPRKLRADVDVDLETICLKCLDKDPLARYSSADAMADDLERWLDGKPIEARPVTTTERLVKWSRRQPLLAGSLATIAVTVLGLLILAGFFWQNAEARAQAVKSLGEANGQLAQVNQQREQAEAKKTEAEKLADEQRRIADAQKALADKIEAKVGQLEKAASAAEQKLVVAERNARRTIYAADMQLAHAAWQNENIATVNELLERYRAGSRSRETSVPEEAEVSRLQLPASEDLRGFEWHYLNRQMNRARLSWSAKSDEDKGSGTIWGMAVSPDRKLLATVQIGNELKLWNLADGKLLRIVSEVTKNSKGEVQTNFAGVFFADEGRQLVAIARKNVDMDKYMATINQAMGGKGTMNLSSLTEPFELRTWTLADESPARVEPFDPRRLQTPVLMASVGGFFAADGGKLLSIMAMDRSADGKYLAMAGSEMKANDFSSGDPSRAGRVQTGRLIIWDIEKGQIHAQQNSPVVLTTVAFSPDGESLAIATMDGAVGVGKVDLAQPPRLMLGHHGFVNSLHFSADGSRLASSSSDGLVLVWDVAEAKEVDRLHGHLAGVTRIELAPGGESLVSAGGDGTVKVWDLNRPQQSPVLHVPDSRVSAMTFSKDGRELISAEVTGAVKVWSAGDGKLIRELPAVKGTTDSVRFLSPHGNLMTWPSWNRRDNRIVLRNLADGAEREIVWKDQMLLYSDFSADERLIACSNHAGDRIGIWNIADGKQLKELESAQKYYGLALSSNGKLLAQRGQGAVLWDWQAGTSRTIVDESEIVSVVAFSADDKLLAAVSDKAVRIWDLQTDQLRTEFRPAGQSIAQVAFSPDGRRMATTALAMGQSICLNLWDTTSGREVFSARLPTNWITAIAFSPDGHRLAAATTVIDLTAGITGRKVPSEIHIWDATRVPSAQ